MLSCRLCCFIPIILMACLLQTLAHAQNPDVDKPSDNTFTLSGFGTLGAAYSPNRRADVIRDLSQPNGIGSTRRVDWGLDSLLGLQVNANASENLETVLQVISSRASSGYRPRVTWAFAKYKPNEQVQLRVGRLGADLYLYADSRHIGYSYLSVRPNMEFYGSLVLSYIDGADASVKFPLENGVLSAKIYAGKAREKILALENPYQYYSFDGSPLVGGHIEYQGQHWTSRIGFAQLTTVSEFPQVSQLQDVLRSPIISALSPLAKPFADDLTFKDKTLRYVSLGLEYDKGPLQAQFMIMRLRANTLSFANINSAFLTLGVRHDNWTPYVTYSIAKGQGSQRSTGLPAGIDPFVDALIAGTQAYIERSRSSQHTWTFGARADISETTNIKVQVDKIRAKNTQFFRHVAPDWNGNSNVYSVALNFVF